MNPDRLHRAPPPAWAHDPSWHARWEEVFARHWTVPTEVIDAAESASAIPFPQGGEPLLWTRDAGGAERVLSNVCTHRAALLLREPSPLSALRCPYHGRRFQLDGRCTLAPGFEGREETWAPLPAGGAARWGPLPLASAFPGPDPGWREVLSARLPGLDPACLRRDPSGDRAYLLNASWMTYLENYLEGLHIPFVHPTLSRALDLRAYRHEVFSGGTAQLAPARRGESTIPWAKGQDLAALFVAFFPGTLLNFYPWGLSLNVVVPLGPGRCEVRYRRFLAGSGEHPAPLDLDQVEREDQEVVERVALGLRSRRAPRSPYALGHEDGLRHFHGWLWAQLPPAGSA